MLTAKDPFWGFHQQSRKFIAGLFYCASLVQSIMLRLRRSFQPHNKWHL